MRQERLVRAVAIVLALFVSGCAADGSGPSLDDLLRGAGVPSERPLTEARIAQGLKEALRVGAENAVRLTGRRDGYFGDARLRIPMPRELETLDRTLRRVGLGAEVDRFVLSMNRAAEAAAPEATRIFWDAAARMTIADARGILSGPDTAATDYFRSRTSAPLASAFRPIVDRALGQVGVTRQYQALVARYDRIPLAKPQAVDLDDYVTARALDGLFLVLGDEERKIRADPAARVTEILRDVFGRRA